MRKEKVKREKDKGISNEVTLSPYIKGGFMNKENRATFNEVLPKDTDMLLCISNHKDSETMPTDKEIRASLSYLDYIKQFDSLKCSLKEAIEMGYNSNLGIRVITDVVTNDLNYDKSFNTLHRYGKRLGLESNRRVDVKRKTLEKDEWLLHAIKLKNNKDYDIANPLNHIYNDITKEIGVLYLNRCWFIDFKRATFKPLSTAHHAKRVLEWDIAEVLEYIRQMGEIPIAIKDGEDEAIILIGIIYNPILNRIYHKIWFSNVENQIRVEELIVLAQQYNENVDKLIIDRDTNEVITEVWKTYGITPIYLSKNQSHPYNSHAEQPFSNIAKVMYEQRSKLCPKCETNGYPTELWRQKDNYVDHGNGIYTYICNKCGHSKIVYEWTQFSFSYAIAMFRALVEVSYYKKGGRLQTVYETTKEQIEQRQIQTIPTISNKVKIRVTD